MQIIQLGVIILLYSQLTIADMRVDPLLGPHYEYDSDRAGWYIPDPAHTIQVNPMRSRYPDIPQIYHDFVNRTLSRQPTGVCQKEVP